MSEIDNILGVLVRINRYRRCVCVCVLDHQVRRRRYLNGEFERVEISS